MVTLVFLRALCEYVWVNTLVLTLSPQRVDSNWPGNLGNLGSTKETLPYCPTYTLSLHFIFYSLVRYTTGTAAELNPSKIPTDLHHLAYLIRYEQRSGFHLAPPILIIYNDMFCAWHLCVICMIILQSQWTMVFVKPSAHNLSLILIYKSRWLLVKRTAFQRLVCLNSRPCQIHNQQEHILTNY